MLSCQSGGEDRKSRKDRKSSKSDGEIDKEEKKRRKKEKKEKKERRRARTKLKRAARKASIVAAAGGGAKKGDGRKRKGRRRSVASAGDDGGTGKGKDKERKKKKDRRKSKGRADDGDGDGADSDDESAPPILEAGPDSAASSPPAAPIGMTSGPDKRRLYQRHPSIALIKVEEIPEEFKEEIEGLRRQLEVNVMRKEAAQKVVDARTEDLHNLIHNKAQIKKDTKVAIKLLKAYQEENVAIIEETGEVQRQHEEAMTEALAQDPVNRYLARSGWDT